MWKSTFSALTIFIYLGASAQGPGDPKGEPVGSRISLKLSYDLIPNARSLFIERQKSGGEFQASFQLNQYAMNIEYGFQNMDGGSNYSLVNEGSYIKLGPEINLLKNAKDGLALTFGLRYAQSSFSNQFSYSYEDNVFGPQAQNDRVELDTRWMELTTGLSTRIWKNLTMGYTIRFKILRSDLGESAFLPFDIPGFGMREDSNEVGFNYYIGWTIPLN